MCIKIGMLAQAAAPGRSGTDTGAHIGDCSVQQYRIGKNDENACMYPLEKNKNIQLSTSIFSNVAPADGL